MEIIFQQILQALENEPVVNPYEPDTQAWGVFETECERIRKELEDPDVYDDDKYEDSVYDFYEDYDKI